MPCKKLIDLSAACIYGFHGFVPEEFSLSFSFVIDMTSPELANLRIDFSLSMSRDGYIKGIFLLAPRMEQ